MLSTQAVQDTRCGQSCVRSVSSKRRVLEGLVGWMQGVRIEAILQTKTTSSRGYRVGNTQLILEQMQNTNPNETDESSDADNAETAAQSEHEVPAEHDGTVTPERRAEALAEYGHRCQYCGRYSPEKGGLATLQVHHIDRDPDGMDEHDLDNLTLLCRSCHSWFHQQSTPADAPVEITDADQTELLTQDIEILQYLSEHGPALTGDIASELSTDLTVSSIRERLWVLMGLDNLVESRDQQIVDKDVETGEWGLVEQIEHSARGHIPDDPRLLVQRMEDELARQAIDRGCTRSYVTEVLDVSRRTTFNKEKRACAYDFPLEALDRGGRPTDSASAEQSTISPEPAGSDEDAQQQLATATDHEDDPAADTSESATHKETGSADDQSTRTDDDSAEQGNQPSNEALAASVQQAITALQEIEDAIEVA